MRKSTIASLLILCGSTAALANVAVPGGQATANNMTNMSNDTTMDPMPGPGNTMNDPSMNPDNGVTTNEANPRPM